MWVTIRETVKSLVLRVLKTDEGDNLNSFQSSMSFQRDYFPILP